MVYLLNCNNKHPFLFCNAIFSMGINFLFAGTTIEKCSKKIGVAKLCYALQSSCSGIRVKIFENIGEEITKK